MAVESTFGIEIPDAVAAHLLTVGALYDYVATHVPAPATAAKPGSYSGPLWERYLDVLEHELRGPRSAFQPQARFVRDLRVD